MGDNTGKLWSVNDLMKRYNINRASLIEYAKAKIDIINKDDIHAKKAGKEWQFDAEAVRILDELRGYGIVIENYDSPEKAKIAELEKELEEARKFMAAAQTENARQKDRIIALLEAKETLLEEKAKADQLLACAAAERKMAEGDIAIIQKTLELENKAANSEIERQQVEINGLKEERATDKAVIESLQRKLQVTEAALNVEKNKTFWQRIFG
jgi:chromosome segregation ATPase